ncbi:hypothetical protein [Pedobacter frigiditerrae]|uniref:hypothetical protein n=1 Tax=Pedobacter frigiditerrae TaxID=2530452 RepID=UPI00292F58EB|nr:hypothetical protein [Pedobacter frigiditerrae]
MIITSIYFNNLKLAYNDPIDLMIETGERFLGRYRGDFDSYSFKFYNNTRGSEEIILLKNLQRLEKQ